MDLEAMISRNSARPPIIVQMKRRRKKGKGGCSAQD